MREKLTRTLSSSVMDLRKNRLYKPDFNVGVSTDGGQSFTQRGGRAHGDYHTIWVNPQDTFQIYVGTDGGVYQSNDKANTFKFCSNIPVGQFYHVSFDMEQPYNVYGGLQDNGSWMGPSQSPGGVENKDWRNVGFGDGFFVWADPLDKDIVYSEFQGGNVLRFHKSTGEVKWIKPLPKQGEPKYRFNWNTALGLSPTNKKVIYIGAQFLFRSTDKGESWERISNDLTTNDPAKQKQEESGGLSIDNSSAENHCTIVAVAESPLDERRYGPGPTMGICSSRATAARLGPTQSRTFKACQRTPGAGELKRAASIEGLHTWLLMGIRPET